MTLRCECCGWSPPRVWPWAWRCPRCGTDEGDHLLAPQGDLSIPWPSDPDENPFVRYRALLHAHRAALALGLSDARYVSLVRALDDRVAAVDGRGFRITPFARGPVVSGVSTPWVKNDSVNVSGSHKGRHLFGLLLHLEIAREAGLDGARAPLAIASCGNAALAAAVLARAGERALDVFVPPDAHPRVLARLRDLGAAVHVCARAPGELGDPCVTAFRAAVARGAIPFACQGTDNGLTLDGGKTLGYELADTGFAFDRIWIQVGGGALASSVSRALEEACARGLFARCPRVMAVQSAAVAPLAAAHARVTEAARARVAGGMPEARALDAALADLRAHRGRYLQAWPTPATSVAHGILDDETYDGAAVLAAVLRTNGGVVTVDEPTLREAEGYGGGRVDATGTAGLAGLIAWSRERPRAEETHAVLFTGARRG